MFSLLRSDADAICRGYDLAMKHTFNSKERDADEWAELLRAASARFKIQGIRQSPGSFLSLIEVVFEDE